MNKFTPVLFLLLFCSLLIQAQENRYAIYFNSKSNTPFSTNNPVTFLSQKSIDRRIKQGVSIIEEDLPVDPVYLSDLKGEGINVHETSKWLNCALVSMTPTKAESIKLKNYVMSVEFVAPGASGGRLTGSTKFNDITTFGSDTLFQNQIMDIPLMHQEGYTGAGITIAIMDAGFTGISTLNPFQHLLINNQLIYTYDFLSHSTDVFDPAYKDHGTKVLSTLAAQSDSLSYTGIVPDACYALLNTEDLQSEYRVEEYYWLIAAEKADSLGADIISTSLGYNLFDDPSMNYTTDELDGQTAIITQAAEKASSKAMLVIASAGNEGTTSWQKILFPSDADGVLSIGSINSSFDKSIFSAVGPSADGRTKPDLVTQGSGVIVINGNGSLVANSGTSFSTPQVAGLAAGLWQAFPELSSTELMQALKNSATQAGVPDNSLGYGVPSFRAVQNFVNSTQSEKQVDIFPIPAKMGEKVHIRINDPVENSKLKWTIYNRSGEEIKASTDSFTWQDNDRTFDTAGLRAGIYLIVLEINNAVETYKFVLL